MPKPTLQKVRQYSAKNQPHWYLTGWGIAFLALLGVILILLVVLAWQIIGFFTQSDFLNLNTNTGQTVGLTGQNSQDYTTQDDPSWGSRTAKVKIVEFGDFQCPYCRQMWQPIRRILADYGDQIFFQFRDFPVSDIHPDATKAAQAADCAFAQGRDKFWAFHDKLYQYQEHLAVADLKLYAQQIGLNTVAFNTCLDSGQYSDEVEGDFQDGLTANLDGTPTFFINGYRYAGVIPENTLRQVIDTILKAK